MPPVSVACTGSDTASPAVFDWLLGGVRTSTPPMVQLKVTLLLEVPSLAVTVGLNEPMPALPAATVPEMTPVPGLIDSPPGSPTAA